MSEEYAVISLLVCCCLSPKVDAYASEIARLRLVEEAAIALPSRVSSIGASIICSGCECVESNSVCSSFW